MNPKDTHSPAAVLLEQERALAQAELRAALARLPAAVRRSSNPIRWFRRYPVAASGIAALSAIALITTIRAVRAGGSPGRGGSWLRRLSLHLLGAIRRSLTTAVAARLAMRGVGAPQSGVLSGDQSVH